MLEPPVMRSGGNGVRTRRLCPPRGFGFFGFWGGCLASAALSENGGSLNGGLEEVDGSCSSVAMRS